MNTDYINMRITCWIKNIWVIKNTTEKQLYHIIAKAY